MSGPSSAPEEEVAASTILARLDAPRRGASTPSFDTRRRRVSPSEGDTPPIHPSCLFRTPTPLEPLGGGYVTPHNLKVEPLLKVSRAHNLRVKALLRVRQKPLLKEVELNLVRSIDVAERIAKAVELNLVLPARQSLGGHSRLQVSLACRSLSLGGLALLGISPPSPYRHSHSLCSGLLP